MLGVFDESDVICGYSRREAIEDGTLVDVSEMAQMLGFRVPVAMTRAAWCDCVEWTAEDEGRKGIIGYQDMGKRLEDVLWSARTAGISKLGWLRFERRVLFDLWRVPAAGCDLHARRVTLAMLIHEGDEGETVATIMLPSED